MGAGAGMGEADAAVPPRAVAPLPLPLGSAALRRALEVDRVGGMRERSWERERMGAGAGMGEEAAASLRAAAPPHDGPDDHVAAALNVLCKVRAALAVLMSESRAVPWELRVGPFLILPACDDRERTVRSEW